MKMMNKIRGNRLYARLATVLLLLGCIQPALTQNSETKGAAPAVAASYLLQPGDEVSVSVRSVMGYDSITAIAPDGIIYLKGIGEIRAAGMTIRQLTEQITSILAKKLRRPNATVQLTKQAPPPPPNKITVVGSVIQPGPRDLVEGLRVAKAIELANGAARDADLAKVVIVRGLKRISVDLSKPEYLTDADRNVLLEEGDSVYVPAIPPKVTYTITVSGAVGTAGPVRTEEAVRLFKAIELAGGPNKEADLSRVTLRRSNLEAQVIDLSTTKRLSDPAVNVMLADGDSIEVPGRDLTVSIAGAVVSPGTYELKPGWSLNELITAAGKMTLLANTHDVKLHRAGEEPRSLDLNSLAKSGTVVALQSGDRVVIPEEPNQVLLSGAIDSPGFRSFKPGMKLSQFFQGNPDTAVALNSTKVDQSKAELLRGDQYFKFSLKKIRQDPKSKDNIELQGGDQIILRGKEPRTPSPFGYAISALGVLGNLFAF